MTNIERQIENKLAELGEYVSFKKIILFGAGIYSRQLYSVLRKHGYPVYAVIDNNQSLAGHLLEQTVIQYAGTFLEKNDDSYIFLILSRFYYEMKKQLEESGYIENIHFFQMAVIDMIDDWHIVDEDRLDKCILNIKRGRKIYEQLTELYGRDAVFLVNPVASIGDVYLMSFYAGTYVKENPGSVFIFGSHVLEKLANWLKFGYVSFVELDDIQALIDYAKVFGFERVNIKLLHTGYIHFRLWSRMLTYVGIPWMEHYRELFGLPDYTKICVTKLISGGKCGKIFTEYDLIPGKTVVLSPYANTIRQFSEEFWESLAVRLQTMGFTVCTNVGSVREKAVAGTVPVYVEIDNISEFVEIAGYFIGIRSGLCDLLCCCECIKIILYSDEIFDLIPVYDFYSLKKMGFGNDVLEYVINNVNVHKISEDILLVMKEEAELEDRKLCFKNVVQQNGRLWFWEERYNGLFNCEFDKKYAVKVSLKRKQDLLKGSLYSKVILYRDKIIGIPYMADNILIYEIDSQRERYIQIDGIYKFAEYVINEKYVFLLGYGSSVILKFDMDQEMVTGYIDVYTGNKNERGRTFFESGFIYKDKLLVPDYWEYDVYEIDVNTMHFTKYKIRMADDMCPNICIDKRKDEIYFPPDNMKTVVMWNRESENRELYLFPSCGKKEEVLIFNLKDYIFYVQKFSITRSLESYYKNKNQKDRLFELFFYSQVCNEFIYILDETKKLFIYYPKEDIQKEKVIYLSRNDYIEYMKLQLPIDIDKYQVVYEKFYSVAELVQYVKNEFPNRNVKNKDINPIGGRILKTLEQGQGTL